MPKIRKNFNPGPAQLGLNHGPGKGSADRSPGWRQHYNEIGWPVVIDGGGRISKQIDSQFQRVGSKLIKKY